MLVIVPTGQKQYHSWWAVNVVEGTVKRGVVVVCSL